MPRKIIRSAEVRSRTGKSRTQLWRDVRAGRFPAPIELGVNSIGWFEDEVEDWLDSRPRRGRPTREAIEPEAVVSS